MAQLEVTPDEGKLVGRALNEYARNLEQCSSGLQDRTKSQAMRDRAAQARGLFHRLASTMPVNWSV